MYWRTENSQLVSYVTYLGQVSERCWLKVKTGYSDLHSTWTHKQTQKYAYEIKGYKSKTMYVLP